MFVLDVEPVRCLLSMAFLDLSLNRCKGLIVSLLKETQRDDVAETEDDKNISGMGDSVA